MKKVLVLLVPIFLLVFFSSSVFGFGQEEGFGDESFDEWVQEDFFIHDTLIKAVFLLFFLLLASFIYQDRRRWRPGLLVLSFLVLGLYLGGFLCPLAVVQNALYRYASFFLILFFIPLFFSLIRGRLYCGAVCPFGAAQELLHQKSLRFQPPQQIQKKLHLLKYFFLLFLMIRFLITWEVILVGETPFKALFLFGGTGLSIALTIITAILSLFLFRPFCQYLCPYGALLGLVAAKSPFTLIPKACNQCSYCSRECPLSILEKGVVDKKECLLCGACVDVCIRKKKLAKGGK